ncbi:MAG TPA: GAF domain-containing protein [Candidatus Dormibacteraeota bacterium]|nr:GAF domain-containing protein [Candidatus Dormibacteraeota bacterium]
MTEQTAADFAILVDGMVRNAAVPDSEALEKIANALGRLFGVDSDEVAVLSLNAKAKTLKFVIPEKLSTIGTIPLSSATALAARTARERRPELVNNFSSSRHASVFEGVPLGRDPRETIQKIMSAPVLRQTRVCGVVQISRKGRTTSDAGADFTQKDLHALTLLSPTLDIFLNLCRPDA